MLAYVVASNLTAVEKLKGQSSRDKSQGTVHSEMGGGGEQYQLAEALERLRGKAGMA